MTGGSKRRRLGIPLLVAGAGAVLAAGTGIGHALSRVNSIANIPRERVRQLRAGNTSPLLERFPELGDRLPWMPIGSFPTPVQEMPEAFQGSAGRLFVKRDDLANPEYGGNKVRKLEFSLAEASLSGCDTLITLGGVGSNHALATAAHGIARGFEVDLVLYDQPVIPIVRRNLGAFLARGARLHYAGGTPRAFALATRLHRLRTTQGFTPYFIMVGGSSRLGCMGFVSAALELAEQVRQGLLPEPDDIFVPLGTCGTAAGLIVGLKLAGLRSRVQAVRVATAVAANTTVLQWMAQDVADTLHALSPSIPHLQIRPTDFDVLTEHVGEGYGVPTAEAESAVSMAAPDLLLETTYTGKALAACQLFRDTLAEPRNVLFWNTYNSAPVPEPASWDGLPSRLRHIGA